MNKSLSSIHHVIIIHPVQTPVAASIGGPHPTSALLVIVASPAHDVTYHATINMEEHSHMPLSSLLPTDPLVLLPGVYALHDTHVVVHTDQANYVIVVTLPRPHLAQTREKMNTKMTESHLQVK